MALLKILLTVSGEINSKAKNIKCSKGTATAVEWGSVRDHTAIRFYFLLKKLLNEDVPSSFREKIKTIKIILWFCEPGLLVLRKWWTIHESLPYNSLIVGTETYWFHRAMLKKEYKRHSWGKPAISDKIFVSFSEDYHEEKSHLQFWLSTRRTQNFPRQKIIPQLSWPSCESLHSHSKNQITS